MKTTKDPHPKPDAFWDGAAVSALAGILASSNHTNAAMNAAGFADALVQERSNRMNSDVALTPTSLDVEAAGIPSSSFGVTVGGLPKSWMPVASAPWITIIDPKAFVQGDGTVTFSVAENDDDAKRTATIDIEAYDLTFTVDQDAGQKKTKAESDPNNPVPEPEPEPESEPVVAKHPIREVEHSHSTAKKKH